MDPANPELGKRIIKKPGASADRSKALDNLVLAKTTGIRRTAQYEVNFHFFFYKLLKKFKI